MQDGAVYRSVNFALRLDLCREPSVKAKRTDQDLIQSSAGRAATQYATSATPP